MTGHLEGRAVDGVSVGMPGVTESSLSRPLLRRAALRGLAGCIGGTLLLSPAAFAGSYMDRASILLAAAGSELDYLGRKLYDDELARVLKRVASARAKAAGEMMVPREVVLAHPHLLMMLESCERAADAAVEKQAKDYLKYARTARDEDELFRSVMKQLGWPVASVK